MQANLSPDLIFKPVSRRVIGTLLGALLMVSLGAAPRAQSGVSEASALSALPIAVSVSVAAPVMVLSAAGAATAFIPNAVGTALLYNERVTR